METSLPLSIKGRRAVALLAMALTLPALAADPEIGTLRVGYDVSYRHGGQTDSGPGLSYNGYSFNNTSLEGWYFPSWIGAAASIERESFSLLDNQSKVTGGAFYRGNVGPAFRIKFGPARVELTAAYSLATMPLFSNTLDVAGRRAQRQAVMVGGRAVLDWPWRDALELRGDYPIEFDVRTSDGALGGRMRGFNAGAGIRAPIYTGESFAFGLVFSWKYVQDTVYTSDGRTSAQYLNRFGVAADFSFLPVKPKPPTTGFVLITLAGQEGQALPPDTSLELVDHPTVRLVKRQDGAFEAYDVPQGPVTFRASARGFVTQEAPVTVVAGGRVPLELALEKVIPRTGILSLKVTEHGAETTPVRRALVTINGEERPVEPDGTLVWSEIPRGLVNVSVKAPGYQAANETANVQGGQTAELALSMVRLEVKLPATISGLVRSSVDGTPIQATLNIPRAKVNLTADEKGAFSTEVKGGSYRVTISAEGFATQTKTFTVKDGDQAIFNVDLNPARSRKSGKTRGKR